MRAYVFRAATTRFVFRQRTRTSAWALASAALPIACRELMVGFSVAAKYGTSTRRDSEGSVDNNVSTRNRKETTMSEQNAAIAQQAYNNFTTGDIQGLLDLLSEDVTW